MGPRSRATVTGTLLSAAWALLATGCERAGDLAHDLLPRTHTVSTSPDGRTLAFVRQHLNPDPPDDHLYLARAGESPRHLMALAPDADWCRAILWTRDGRRVGFVVNDQRLAVYDVGTGRLVAMMVLVSDDGEDARDVVFDEDGGGVTFERFRRARVRFEALGAWPAFAAPVSRLPVRRMRPHTVLGMATRLGREHRHFEPAAASLLLVDGDGRPLRDRTWVQLKRRPHERPLYFDVTPQEGLVHLPAVAPEDLRLVEIGRPGQARTALVRDLLPGAPPTRTAVP